MTKYISFSILHLSLTIITIGVSACGDEGSPRTELTPMGGQSLPSTGGMVVTDSGLMVTAPLQGAIFGSKEFTVTGTHPTAVMVTVNEQSVPVMNGQFSAMLTMNEGTHTITVSDSSKTIMIDIMVDLTPPVIEIGSPGFGLHLDSAQNQTVAVIGNATDALSGVTEAMVNGEVVPVNPNGAFQYTYQPQSEGLELITVTLSDRAGHQSTAYRSLMYGRFKEWATPVQDGLGMFMSPNGLDALEIALKTALDQGLISELIIGSIDPNQGILIEEIEVMNTIISLEPRDGFLDILMSLQGLRIHFSIESPATSGDVYVDAILSAQLYLDVAAGGALDVRIEEPSVTLSNFDIYANGPLGVGADFLEGFIGDFAEEALLSVVRELLVEGFIDPSLFRPTLTVLDTPLELQILVESAEINPNGIELKTGLGLASPDTVRQAPGYLYDTTPITPEILPSMISSYMTLNSLQMILGQIWRSGIIDINLLDLVSEPPSALTAGLLSTFTNGALLEYMEATEYIGVRLRPSLPPVSRFRAPEPQALFVDLNDLLIDFTLPNGDPWLTLGLNLTARVEPSIISNDLQLTTSLEVKVWSVATPLFEVDTDRVIGLFEPIIQNLPNLVGVQAGADPLISISELDLFGIQISSTSLQTRPSPGGVAFIGLQVFSP